MYLRSLRLENIACFEELDLDFTDENGKPCKWVVLLGENGVGKSTILRMLAATSLGYLPLSSEIKQHPSPFLGINFQHLIRKNQANNNDIKFISTLCLTNEGQSQGFKLSVSDLGVSSVDNPNWVSHVGIKKIRPFMYGYSKSTPPENLILSSDNRIAVKRFGRLFGYNEFSSYSEWIRSLYVRSIHPSKTERDEIFFDSAINVLNKLGYGPEHVGGSQEALPERAIIGQRDRIHSHKLSPNIRYKEVTIDGEVLVYDGNQVVNLDDLSDGYRALSDWVFDLVHWLFDAFPDGPSPDESNPLKAEGVVLIDEIDLHLHPKWQRTIVKQIRETFPNLQFIVTSHSPFVAQDMTEKDKIIVLTREGDKVTAREEKGFVQGWRADQILTSWLFGMETTRDESIESLEKERVSLRQREEGNLLTETERDDLDRVTRELESMRSGDVPLDRKKLEAAAALVMELMSKTL